jgi:hypothetical protein
MVVSVSASTVGPPPAAENRGLPKGVEPVPQSGRQGLFELGQRSQRGLLDPGDRAGRRGAQPHPHGDGLIVVEQQRRHRGTCPEPVAAGDPGVGMHLVAEDAQPFDIVAHGSGGDAEAAGEVGAGPVPPYLQQRQEPDRRLQHFSVSYALRNQRFHKCR